MSMIPVAMSGQGGGMSGDISVEFRESIPSSSARTVTIDLSAVYVLVMTEKVNDSYLRSNIYEIDHGTLTAIMPYDGIMHSAASIDGNTLTMRNTDSYSYYNETVLLKL